MFSQYLWERDAAKLYNFMKIITSIKQRYIITNNQNDISIKKSLPDILYIKGLKIELSQIQKNKQCSFSRYERNLFFDDKM